MGRSVFILGSVPPPVGGISVHVDRLANMLSADGWDVTVFDLAVRRRDGLAKYALFRMGPFLTVVKLIGEWLVRNPDVLHLHFSRGDSGAYLAPLIWLFGLRTRIIISIHSGSFLKWDGRDASIKGGLLKLCFACSERIVAVSEGICDHLIRSWGVDRKRISVVPAFILDPTMQVASKGKGKRPSIGEYSHVLASGYATETYFWEGFIQAVSDADGIGKVSIAFYHEYQEPYYTSITRAINADNGPEYCVYRDLDPAEFFELLSGADVFVRPTWTDGDSVSVREALALGKKVVASDAVGRPDGCLIHRAGDVGDLRDKIELACRSEVEPVPRGDFGGELLRLYDEVITSDVNRAGNTKK